jgi:flagellar biosynthetic protein FliP
MSLPTAGEMPIRLEGRLSLGPKKSLVLVNCRLTLLTLLPALLLAMTPMVRLLVVFHFLRQALGTQTAPSTRC